MSIINTPTAIQDASDVCQLASGILGREIISAERIGGSGNNRVYALTDAESQRAVIKFYFRHPADKRDRLDVEFKSLSFLSSQGLIGVPRPLAVDPEKSCAVYEFIEGERITATNTRMDDVKSALSFVADLKHLNPIAASHDIALASDACFSIAAVIANVEGRLKRFAHLQESGKEHQELNAFLNNQFKPFFVELMAWSQAQCADTGILFDKEIGLHERTLSPSDFGFHNALRASGNKIVFLDFEYFGWDDPAKMTVDFILHPAMTLSDAMKQTFVQGMRQIFGDNPQFKERVRIVYPLFGLKWCMIFLNEFVPNDFSRRAFAAANPIDRSELLKRQLTKAQNLLSKLKNTYEDFS